MNAPHKQRFGLKAVYDIEVRDKHGRLKFIDRAENRVPTAACNDLLTTYFKGSAYTATWFLGLIGALATGTITGATQANPCVITQTAHGRSTGDRIVIAGVAGMTALNNKEYKITVINANTYSLDGINSTGYGAYTSGGTVYIDPSADANTAASHAGWTELTAYSEANRQALTLGTAAAGQIDNTAAKATFTCNANGTVAGALFIISNNTKGGTTGTLFSVAPFLQGNKSLDSGDEITVGVTLYASGA